MHTLSSTIFIQKISRLICNLPCLNQCELRTKNSLELTYRYYGYVKPITPAILNQVIDDVATRVQLENEYARTVHAPSPQDEKEDQLTLNELGQFEH